MINGLNPNNLAGQIGTAAGGPKPTAAPTGPGFSEVLKGQIDEVAKLQQDASQAVEDVATGRTDDVAGVMTAMEKSDIAFKTLLAIRAKLMDAYEEIKGISI
ncbi:MAG TPA: flagellar hook-basal body complex protein FliE [Humisphaera sp.]